MWVLLVRVGALGDLLLLRRTIASLKEGGHSVALLAPAAPGAVLVGPGPSGVDQLIPWERIDVARFLADAPPEGTLASALAHSDAVIAYTRSPALSQALQATARRVLTLDPNPPSGHHASRWLAQPLGSLGVEVVETVPTDTASPEEGAESEQRTVALPRDFLAIHPGSGSPLKNWPASRFADFAAAWHALTGRDSLLLCRGPAEAGGSPDLHGLRHVVAENWPARVLGAVLARAGLFLGNDSGVTHLAAAWGAPTLGLFGPTDPDVWSPCGARTRSIRSATGLMQDLSVDAVLGRARELAPLAQATEHSAGRVGPRPT